MTSCVKRTARVLLKGVKTWLRGYPLHYAKSSDRCPERPSDYQHPWIKVCTPIPNKGTAAVRASRLVNLQIAIDRLHGAIVRPGQILAFWHHVPAPIERNGFRRGPVFVRGQVKIDVGGGLCLIATNLFDALLYSGFEILERHGHSIDPYGDDRFFTLGEDAAVAYGYKDLIARNAHKTSLYLSVRLDRDRNLVRTEVWGITPCELKIQVESQVLEEFPPPQGQGQSGWHVRTQRTIAPTRAGISSDIEPAFAYETIYEPCQALQPT